VFKFTNYNPSVNPRHPIKGNDAFLVVDYSSYVAPDSDRLHPSPRIERQDVKSCISSEECNEIIVVGAKNSPYDGIIQLFIYIDGVLAISTSEVKSGWNQWIHVISSFGIKCDNTSHKIEIRVNQWVSEILGLLGRWQEIFREMHELKFDKPSAKEKGKIMTKIKKRIMDH